MNLLSYMPCIFLLALLLSIRIDFQSRPELTSVNYALFLFPHILQTFIFFAVVLATVAALPQPAPQNIAPATKNAPAVAEDLEASDDLKGAESIGQ
jgi:hypothetical protein